MDFTLHRNNKSENTSIKITQALLYCLLASLGFVGSLYIFLPHKVKLLDRDNALQIKWRAASTSLVCLAALTAFLYIFETPVAHKVRLPNSISKEIISCVGVLLNCGLLYLGPILLNICTVHEFLQRRNATTTANFVHAYYDIYFSGLVNGFRSSSNERWIILRNLVIAPLTEEILFRGCIVSTLAMTRLQNGFIVLIAPLFFAAAHIHHARMKIQQGHRVSVVAMQTLFQLTYTSLFGSYASYVYLRTRSLLAAVMGHSFCNAMGLPSLRFLHNNAPSHSYCKLLIAAHLVGIVAFGLSITTLLPKN